MVVALLASLAIPGPPFSKSVVYAQEPRLSEEDFLFLKQNAMNARNWGLYQITNPAIGSYGAGNIQFGTEKIERTQEQISRALLAGDSSAHFETAPSRTSPVFGALLAIRLFEMWKTMRSQASKEPFFVIELGGGSGRLAHDVLNFIEDGPHPNETEKDWRSFYNEIRFLGFDIGASYVDRQNELNRRFLEEGKFLALQGDALNLSRHPFFFMSNDHKQQLFGHQDRETRQALLSQVRENMDSESQKPFLRAIFVSNELPDSFPFHLLQVFSATEGKKPNVLFLLPHLAWPTFERIFTLFLALAEGSDEKERREVWQTSILEKSKRLREVADKHGEWGDFALPTHNWVYLNGHDLQALQSLLYASNLPPDLELAFDPPLPEYIEAAAQNLNLAQKIALDMNWNTGFQPVVIPLRLSPELPLQTHPILEKNLRILAEELGEGDSRLYGWASDQQIWIDQINRVLDLGYVVTIDYPIFHSLVQRFFGDGPASDFIRSEFVDPRGREKPNLGQPYTLDYFNDFGLGWYDITIGADFSLIEWTAYTRGWNLIVFDSEAGFLTQDSVDTKDYFDRNSTESLPSGSRRPTHQSAGWLWAWSEYGRRFYSDSNVAMSGESHSFAMVHKKGFPHLERHQGFNGDAYLRVLEGFTEEEYIYQKFAARGLGGLVEKPGGEPGGFDLHLTRSALHASQVFIDWWHREIIARRSRWDR